VASGAVALHVSGSDSTPLCSKLALLSDATVVGVVAVLLTVVELLVGVDWLLLLLDTVLLVEVAGAVAAAGPDTLLLLDVVVTPPLVFNSPPIPLSVDEDFCSQPIAERLFPAEFPKTAALPVAFDIVLDFVMPRDLGEVVEALLDGAVTVEVGVLEAAPDPAVDPAELRGVSGFVKLVPPAVAGLALTGLKFLIVAESTVFCRLKFELVVPLLVRGAAVGGPVEPRRGLLLVAEMLLCTPR